MKIVHGLDGDDTVPVVTTPSEGIDVSEHLVNLVGKGNKFLAFESLPPEIEGNIAWTPDGAPLCSEDPEENAEAIADMLADPPLSKVRAAG